jgi:hypothetical protein
MARVCWITVSTIFLAAGIGCTANSPLERLAEARQLAADILIQFTKGADAANRAVMADTDEASMSFAREAERATGAVEKDAAALKPILEGLGYSEETRLLQQFEGRFAEYRTLDRTILELAVENTNLKAQRLSFGPAQKAADAFGEAVEALAPANPGDVWRVEALGANAVAALRNIQVLQAPHIATPDDEVMTRLEKRMADSEADTRSALKALAPVVDPPSRQRLAAATTALDQFIDLHAQIVMLSHRNTNVRSLALSLNEKGKLFVACEESLRTLRDALARRGFTGTR